MNNCLAALENRPDFFLFLFSPAPVVRRRAGGMAGVVLGGRSTAAAGCFSLLYFSKTRQFFTPQLREAAVRDVRGKKEGPEVACCTGHPRCPTSGFPMESCR